MAEELAARLRFAEADAVDHRHAGQGRAVPPVIIAEPRTSSLRADLLTALRRVSVPVCLLLLASPLACVKTKVGPIARSVTEGPLPGATLSIDGKQYRLVGCRSGDRDYFRGVDLQDETRHALVRLVIDPMDGPRLKVVDGGAGSSRTVTLTRNSCRRLEADVEPSGWRVNRVRDFNGLLEAECTSDTGVEVRVHVRFAHCH